NALRTAVKDSCRSYLLECLSHTQNLPDMAWTVLALDLLGEKIEKSDIKTFFVQRQGSDGAFVEGKEKSLGYTYYAVQSLICLADK
ncbi:MAG: hypothetical protein ACFFGZ_17360, partial [Candidatus Thorarchaeota archaeon]